MSRAENETVLNAEEREIARRLAELPAGAPPPELLERLKADVPEDLAERLAVAADDGGGAPPRRRWLAAAAVVVTLVGGGWLAWSVWQVVPPAGEVAQERTAAAVEEPALDEPEMKAREVEAPPAGERAGRRAGEPSEPTVQQAPAEAAPVPSRRLEQSEEDAEEREHPAALEDEETASGPPAEESFAEEMVVTGVEAEIDTRSVAAAMTHDEALPPPPPPPATEAGEKRLREPLRDEAARRAAAPEPEGALSVAAEPAPAQKQTEERRVAPPEPEPPLPVSPFVDTAEDRLSTFGLDVDTGSYTALRAALRDGRLPPPAWVRVEEMVNAYRYGDPFATAAPEPGETFRVEAEGAPYPYAPDPRHRLLRFQVTARPVVPVERRPAVLTLVVDVSGSMDQDGRLEQVKSGLRRLLEELEPADSVALVTFSDAARVDAPHGDPAALAAAVDALATEGGTNAEAGLALGYEKAAAAFREGAVNRVVFLSDGLANAGATEVDALLARVAAHAERGIELTTVGVGMDFNDRLLEQLADRGDGRYLYVDGPQEAERVFVEELTGTLQTVAEEARAQVEFDPRSVVRWRLLGYENRAIADERFRWDHAVDAGEIGAGQTVTVLYEVELADPHPAPGRPLALLKLRWRDPGAELFREEETWLRTGDLTASWQAASEELRLAATVAELAEILRGSPHAAELDAVLREARRLAGERPEDEQVAELVELAERAGELLREEPEEGSGPPTARSPPPPPPAP